MNGTADDIVIYNESREQVEEVDALDRREKKVSRIKTEYMCVNQRKTRGKVNMQGIDTKGR